MKSLCLILILTAFAGITLGQKSETMTIKLFFFNNKLNPDDQDCYKVFPVTRTVPKTAAVATVALQELFKGPTAEEKAKEYHSYEPPETTGIFKRVKVKNGAAYVNFTKAVYTQMGNATSTCGSGFFETVEQTLKQFHTIKKVYYAIEGNANDFYDWVQVGECPHGKHCAASNF